MELLSLSRMAVRLGVTQEWLREQAAARKVPCLVAGKRFLFNPVAVLDALAVQAARPVSDAGKPKSVPVSCGKRSEDKHAKETVAVAAAERVEAMPRADAGAAQKGCAKNYAS